MSSTGEETVNAILNKLFINGAGQTADRMVLVQEDYSGKAKVFDARDLGGWSRLPVRDLLLAALQHREQEVRAEAWLPIESAPRTPGYYQLVARFEGGKLLWWEKAKPYQGTQWKSRGGIVEPTHWMEIK